MNNNYRKIGLTGGIGCGKSTVLETFKRLGCLTIDTDAICHEIYESSNRFKANIISHWGDSILDKNDNILRKEIAKKVFRDKKELKWLNNLIHPLIFEEVEMRTNKASSDINIIIYDVPLLFEVNWENLFSIIISIWSPFAIQKERLKKRNWDSLEITNRINSQYSNDLKLEKADFGIVNSDSKELLLKQCKYILSKITR
jgi:dephospho-CoA kinase